MEGFTRVQTPAVKGLCNSLQFKSIVLRTNDSTKVFIKTYLNRIIVEIGAT